MLITLLSTTAIALCLASVYVQAQGVVLRGRVMVDSSRAPIEGATVLLVGAQRTAHTDALGRFRFSNIALQRHKVSVRRLGFAPLETEISLGSTDAVDVELVLSPIAQPLAEVLVPTTPIARKLVAFHERRRMGIGHFVDSTDIAKEPGTRLSEKLRLLPGLVVTCHFAKCELASRRRPPSLRQGASCPVAISLDGVHLADFQINDLESGAIAAIEWYAGAAQTPPQFNWARNTCGVLMIWTK
jgi:hypothetical protein